VPSEQSGQGRCDQARTPVTTITVELALGSPGATRAPPPAAAPRARGLGQADM